MHLVGVKLNFVGAWNHVAHGFVFFLSKLECKQMMSSRPEQQYNTKEAISSHSRTSRSVM